MFLFSELLQGLAAFFFALALLLPRTLQHVAVYVRCAEVVCGFGGEVGESVYFLLCLCAINFCLFYPFFCLFKLILGFGDLAGFLDRWFG